MRALKTVAVALLVLSAAVAVYVLGILQGWYGELETKGTIAAPERPQVSVVVDTAGKSILFGDLHVHTTFSSDAFRMSLPMVQGDGTHPPADACDFARVCANLDFWALTDHAESLPPALWQESVESVRQCNAVAGDPNHPDMVTFLGYEWTQSGATPDQHYGHKNIIFKGIADGEVPTRPIASPVREGTFASIPPKLRVLPPLRDFAERDRYYTFGRLITEISRVPICADNVASPDLPAECAEVAPTPAELFRKLDEWGLPSLVIPHGTSWGVYSPAGTTLDKQLVGELHDDDRQTLFEIYSGHGTSEVYRDWSAILYDETGQAVCPEPTGNYLPSCWRAGEIIHERCIAEGLPDPVCQARAADTRQRYLKYGLSGWHTVPGTRLEDWLDAGQCRDCFLPAFNYRPGGSAQYGLAITNFDDPEPRRFRFGFIGSSDNHTARPGTGYKEYARHPMTDWWGYRDAASRRLYSTDRGAPSSQPRDVNVGSIDLFNILELERQASFFSTGGLVAVHAQGRSRDAIWDALARKEVYATSGERMLVWFEAAQPDDTKAPVPMGGELAVSTSPRFRVQAMGSFRQKPGCPDSAAAALNPERLELLCRGECYHPSDERKLIQRIEIVRILPQQFAGEPVAPLIADPWKVIECEDEGFGCSGEFVDDEFAATGRDAVYYARAIQEPRLTINAEGLRCEFDDQGRCLEVNPCFGDDRTPADDNCAAELPSVAWTSPIFVDYAMTAEN